ncbi:MAG: Fe(3+) ABC transporter substrate-binding protein [Kiloniellales bacterium]
MRRLWGGLAAMVLLASAAPLAAAELNLYSERHYQTDEQLYSGFTEATGITINRIEGKADELIQRITAEGANSPADVLITVDVGRLWRADEAGLFQPIESKTLETAVPASLRHPDGHWFGFSKRARLIYYNKDTVQPGEIKDYEDLADPKWKGKVCIRSGSNIYNLSLLGSLIAVHGEEGATDWAKGVVANFARDPQGGDTDQIKAVAAGECALAVANSYYFARLLANPEEKAVTDKIGWVFPNQDNRGTHVNISGAGVLAHAPNKEEAVKFLEFLASEDAQRYFADGNNEYPVVEGVAANSTVQQLGDFKADEINVASYGENQPLAQKIFDRAGWK